MVTLANTNPVITGARGAEVVSRKQNYRHYRPGHHREESLEAGPTEEVTADKQLVEAEGGAGAGQGGEIKINSDLHFSHRPPPAPRWLWLEAVRPSADEVRLCKCIMPTCGAD